MSKKKDALPDTFNSLAAQLGDRVKAAAARPAQPAARPAPPPAPPTPAKQKLTPEELMRRAFEAADRGAVYDGKYDGRGFAARDVELIDPTPAPVLLEPMAAEIDPGALMFADAVGLGITRMTQRDRYADLRNHDFAPLSWANETELTTLTAEQLHQPDLSAAQRELLKRSRRVAIDVLNVRHQHLGPAMAEVEAFVRDAANRAQGFVRVITGKGRSSPTGPVLKPAVIEWACGPGAQWVRRWAPETDRSGNFGSVVLELDVAATVRGRG